MSRKTVVGLMGGLVLALSASGLMAQGNNLGLGTADIHVTSRFPPMALHGVVVEMACFKKMGAATVASAEQIACAKDNLAKGGYLGILTDMDGAFKFVGLLADKGYARVVPYIGKAVDVTGGEVLISNNFDYRAYEAKTIAPAKK